MYITLYRNNSDNRTLQKSLTQVSTPLSCDIYGSESIITPRFILEYVGVEANYCYVAELNRYYYIRDIVLAPGGRRILMCEVDVLMSNIDEILNLNCLIVRNENTEFTYLTDEQVMITTDKKLEIIEFTGSVINIDNASSATTNFILAVAGR